MKRKIVVADCETDPFKIGRIPKPFVWGVFDGDNYRLFYKTDDFFDYITSFKCIVYAHNGGKFDWHFILEKIPEHTNIMIINGRIAKFKIKDTEFRDSYSILPIPLSAYQKDKFDYKKLESNVRNDYKQEIEVYLKNDLLFQYEIVSQFIEEFGINLTLAGTASKQWQKIHNVKPIRIQKTMDDILRKYYFGGRVECFKTGIIKKKFKVYDINSAYPEAMLDEHPSGDYISMSESLPKKKKEIERSFITLNCISKGAFPLREKTGLKFPTDNISREYHITGWEYLTAIELNLIKNVKITNVMQFNDKINFKLYVNHFYKRKLMAEKKGDKAKRLFAKLLMNSLYGRFAIDPSKFKEYIVVENYHLQQAQDEGYMCAGELGDKSIVAREAKNIISRYHNVGTAASITGRVRAKMMKSIALSKNVLYCDTDSIACSSLHGKLSDKLGDWDLEAECSEGAIAGKKLYAFKKLDGKFKIASKGARLNEKQIYKIAKGEEIIHKNIAPTFSYKKEPHFIDRKIRLTF